MFTNRFLALGAAVLFAVFMAFGFAAGQNPDNQFAHAGQFITGLALAALIGYKLSAAALTSCFPSLVAVPKR